MRQIHDQLLSSFGPSHSGSWLTLRASLVTVLSLLPPFFFHPLSLRVCGFSLLPLCRFVPFPPFCSKDNRVFLPHQRRGKGETRHDEKQDRRGVNHGKVQGPVVKVKISFLSPFFLVLASSFSPSLLLCFVLRPPLFLQGQPLSFHSGAAARRCTTTRQDERRDKRRQDKRQEQPRSKSQKPKAHQ